MHIYESIVRGLQSYTKSQDMKVVLEEGAKKLSSLEYPLFHRCIKGVIEKEIFLHYILSQYSKKKPEKYLDLERNILYLGIYLLLFTKEKPYAVLSEIVELMKKKRPYLAPVTNGILRNIQREGLMKLNRLSPKEKVRIYHGINNSLFDVLLEDFSVEEIDQLFSMENPSMYVNVLKNQDSFLQELKRREVDYLEDDKGVYILSPVDITSLKAFKNGDIYIQSRASKSVATIDLEKGSKVLDLCCAPGGKSIALYGANENISLVCSDVEEGKLEKIRENFQRLSIGPAEIHLWDGTKPNDLWKDSFDLVIMDVPCSATGLLKEQPEVRRDRKERDIKELIEKQKKILTQGFSYAKEGGLLLYSTCSILSIENEDQVQWFLRHFPVEIADYNQGDYVKGVYRSSVLDEKSEGLFGTLFVKKSKSI